MELFSSFSIIAIFGVNHRPPLLDMSENFVYIHNTEERINEFSIGYMVYPTFHVNKYFKEQVKMNE